MTRYVKTHLIIRYEMTRCETTRCETTPYVYNYIIIYLMYHWLYKYSHNILNVVIFKPKLQLFKLIIILLWNILIFYIEFYKKYEVAAVYAPPDAGRFSFIYYILIYVIAHSLMRTIISIAFFLNNYPLIIYIFP